MSRWFAARNRPAQAVAQLVLVAVVILAVGAGHILTPNAARAHSVAGPVQVGTSFSARRAAALGLDGRAAFREVLGMKFKVVRLPIYWDEVDAAGWSRLDWQVAEAEKAGQPIVLTVGMKSLGWPEFFIPARHLPADAADGGDVARDPALADAVTGFVTEAVSRYRGSRALVAWQVENEPFNRAGPHRWWIGPEVLQREIAAVRSLDDRPLVVNVFGHFNMQMDRASSRSGATLAGLLGFDSDSAERDALAAVGPGDVVGYDVYTRMGYRWLGSARVASAAADWDSRLAASRASALRQGRQAWVTEAQAEPWEADWSTIGRPQSFSAADLERTFGDLRDSGQSTVLLWGAEYWLWRRSQGDPAWLEAVDRILRENAHAPGVV